MMADNKDKARQGKQEVLDQGAGQGGSQNEQSGNAGSGSQSGAGENRESGFVHSSPEANVFPTGSSQADNSSRSRGGDSAAGTPDEGRLGGSGGTSAPGTTGNDPDR
jgi:hypothetical protein